MISSYKKRGPKSGYKDTQSNLRAYLNHLPQNHDGEMEGREYTVKMLQLAKKGTVVMSSPTEVMTMERQEAKLCVMPRGWATVRATGLNGGREAWMESQGTAKMISPSDWEEAWVSNRHSEYRN